MSEAKVNMFKDVSACTTNIALQCPSLKRIKFMMDKFNQCPASNFSNLIQEIFVVNHYTNTHLVNDFHHMIYVHVIDDDQKFQEIFTQFKKDNIICEAKKCAFIQRYWRDRTKKIIESNDEVEFRCTINLVAKIHVYFLHLYDINRLTSHEIDIIEEQLALLNPAGLDEDDEKSNENELLENKRFAIITDFLHQKAQKLNVLRKNVNFATDYKQEIFHTDLLEQMLQQEDIFVDFTKIRTIFGNYEHDKSRLISITINALWHNDEMNALCHIHENKNVRETIYKCILYKYIKREDLDNNHVTEIAKAIINTSYPDISIDEFTAITTKHKAIINGKMFVKGTLNFINKIKFAKLFKSVTNYNKKKFGTLYDEMNSPWTPTLNDYPKYDATVEFDAQQDQKQNSQENEGISMYALGTKFYYWDFYKHHKHFIKANYSDFKQEILSHKSLKFNIKQWNDLLDECMIMHKTCHVKSIQCNGFQKSRYKIALAAPFSFNHLVALKLYTDFSKQCAMFCSILRKANKEEIKMIANWAKLLSECVQCYGSKLKYSKQSAYYRGVSKVFHFEMVVMCFNLPTSTTTDSNVAFVKFCGNEAGLVLQLRQYKESYDVFKFDAAALSDFPDEKEALFFGGETVLRIASIYQSVGQKWISYQKYMKPLNVMLRLINGLSITAPKIRLNIRDQIMLLQFAHDMLQHGLDYLPHSSTQNETLEITQITSYISQLLKYHTSQSVIKLRFEDLIMEDVLLNNVLLSRVVGENSETLDLLNICTLFCLSDKIIILMPEMFILDMVQCESLVHDLQLMREMNLSTEIKLEWPLEMPAENKNNIDEYMYELIRIEWSRKFTTKSVCFECTQTVLTLSVLFTETINTSMMKIHEEIAKFKEAKSKTVKSLSDVSDAKPLIAIRRITKQDIELHFILILEAFVRMCLQHQCRKLPLAVSDKILFFYAKPININLKYESSIKSVLFCPAEYRWRLFEAKILNKIELAPGENQLTSLVGRDIRVTADNWKSNWCNENEEYEVEIRRPMINDFDVRQLELTNFINNKHTATQKSNTLDEISLQWFHLGQEIEVIELESEEYIPEFEDIKCINIYKCGVRKRIKFQMDLFNKHFLSKYVYVNNKDAKDEKDEKDNIVNVEYIDIFQYSLEGYTVVNLLDDYYHLETFHPHDYGLSNRKISIEQQDANEACIGYLLKAARDSQLSTDDIFGSYLDKLNFKQIHIIEITSKIHDFINHSTIRKQNRTRTRTQNNKIKMRSLKWRKDQNDHDEQKYNKFINEVNVIKQDQKK
eukprot:385240_1